jgi:mono/diheme cytochrome c family protein
VRTATTRRAPRRNRSTSALPFVLAAVAGVIAAVALTPLAAQNRARDAALVEGGAEVYAAKCAFCHDRVPEGTALAMLPGAASLTLKYGDAISPYIQERPDLASATTLAVFVRGGAGSMPPFRKTEVTDADLAALAAYFRSTSAKTTAGRTPR